MFDKDLVLLVFNEYVLPEFDLGFVDEAIAALKERKSR